MKHIGIAIGLAMLLSSCSLFDSLTAYGSPFGDPATGSYEGVQIDGITRFRDAYLLTSREICVEFDETLFWEPGDYWDSFEALPAVNLYIDGLAVETFRRGWSADLILEYGENGELAGTHGSWFEYCILAGVPVGNHLLTAEVITARETSTYHWDFERRY